MTATARMAHQKRHRKPVVLLFAGAILASGCSSAGLTTTTTRRSTTTTIPASNAALILAGEFQAGEAATFTTSYLIIPPTQQASTLTIAQEPPNAVYRYARGSSVTEYILVRSKTYLCKRVASWSCVRWTRASPMSLIARLFEVGTNLGYLQDSSPHHATYSSLRVDGIALSCVTIHDEPPVPSATVMICLTAQGVLGSFLATGLGVPSFQILSYRNSVPANVFVLPAPPAELTT